MDSREVEIWFETRKLNALRNAMDHFGIDVENDLMEYLERRYQELVPAEEREQIESTIAEEERVARADHEASRRFSVARVTEGGTPRIFLCERGEDFFSTALRLRHYLRSKYRGNPMYIGKPFLTEPEMERYVAEAISGSPRVVGVCDIDLDAGEIAILDAKTGWHVYQAEDVSVAVYHATRKRFEKDTIQRKKFEEQIESLENLEAQRPVIIRGDQPLPVDALTFDGSVCEEPDMLSFNIPVHFDVGGVFGAHVGICENDDRVKVYANYDMKQGYIRNVLDIFLVQDDGTKLECQYRLTSKECADLLLKMDTYCKQTTGKSLEECQAIYLDHGGIFQSSMRYETTPAPQEPPSGPTLQM